MGYGENEEECGGGGARSAGWTEGGQGAGEEADGGAAACERTEGGAGTMGQGEKEREKGLSIRERSRMIAA